MNFLLHIESLKYRISKKQVAGPAKGTHSNYAWTEHFTANPVGIPCQILTWILRKVSL